MSVIWKRLMVVAMLAFSGIALCGAEATAQSPKPAKQSKNAKSDVPEGYVPQAGVFPPHGAARYLVGELVAVDHVNRRGALRLMGDGVDDRYHRAPSHQFAMLPYGTIRYRGAAAELRDIPLGTVLHGYFHLPPEGDDSVPPPTNDMKRYVPPENHALSLEDTSSFYQRQGRGWKIVSVDLTEGKVQVAATGDASGDGLPPEQNFLIDGSTRVWRGREIGKLEDIAPEQVVQLNLTWAPDWRNGQFHLLDVWLDEESLTVAAEQQRQTHLRYEKFRGLPAWIDHVEHTGDGRGIITATLFAGRDPALVEEFKQGHSIRVAVAEKTLRTWWGDHDYKGGNIVELNVIDSPPPGSSGLQIRVTCNELLEGFRPGRYVRLSSHNWPRFKLPPEERVKSMDER